MVVEYKNTTCLIQVQGTFVVGSVRAEITGIVFSVVAAQGNGSGIVIEYGATGRIHVNRREVTSNSSESTAHRAESCCTV